MANLLFWGTSLPRATTDSGAFAYGGVIHRKMAYHKKSSMALSQMTVKVQKLTMRDEKTPVINKNREICSSKEGGLV